MSDPAPRRGAPAMPRLRAFNVVVGLVHAAQAVVLLLIASDASLPVTVGYLEGPPGSDQRASTELFSLPFAPAVAAFLLLAGPTTSRSPRPARWAGTSATSPRGATRPAGRSTP